MTVFAIARLTFKAAVRTRLMVGSAIILFAITIGLPFLISGDGTAVGEARVLMLYNIGISTFLISALALIQSCGTISQEISERQIQMIRAKPVSTGAIWLGKWLGSVTISALLLVIAFSGTYAAFMARGLKGGEADLEVLTSRRRIAFQWQSIESSAETMYHDLLHAGGIADGADKHEVKMQLKRMIVAERATVGPKQERRWKLDIPAGCSPRAESSGTIVELRSRFNTALRDTKPTLCSWQILDEEGEVLHSVPAAEYYEGMNAIDLPADVVRDRTAITVVFRNEESEGGRTVLLNERRAIEILVRESAFFPNMIRAMMVSLFVTSLLSALGLTLGSLLSFPVALFAAVSIVVGSLAAHFFATTTMEGHTSGGCAHCESADLSGSIGVKIAAVFERVVGPVFEQKIAAKMSEGELVSWRQVGRASLQLVLLYSGILFILGSIGLSRRQLALPETT